MQQTRTGLLCTHTVAFCYLSKGEDGFDSIPKSTSVLQQLRPRALFDCAMEEALLECIGGHGVGIH